MNHTPQIKKAIQFAARKHHGHMRAESEPLPYITHLFSAALLVAECDADDDMVIAALLHDTLEDTPTTREELAATFGESVALLVEHVSESKDAGLSWRERKEAYLAHLTDAPEDALLISIADKVDNIESKLEALERGDTALIERMKTPQSEYLWFHSALAAIATKRLPEHRLTRRLLEAHAREREALS